MSIGTRITCKACGGTGTVPGKVDAFTPDECTACRGRGYTWTSPTPDVKPDGKRKDRMG